jgi:DNA-binding SARP family transcriptional activator
MSQLELASTAKISLASLRDLEQGRVALPRTAATQRIIVVLGLADSAEPFTRSDRQEESSEFRSGSDSTLWLGALGPLIIVRGDQSISLPRRERTLLALLILAQGNAVTCEYAIDTLWREHPPASARAMLHTYISRLRLLMRSSEDTGAGDLISHDSAGYRLRVTVEQLDVLKFRQVIGLARAATDAATACKWYTEAFALWRGPVLDDVPLLQNHHSVIGLRAERVHTVLEFAERAMKAGLNNLSLPHLLEMARVTPFDEQVHAALIVTLAACGKRGQALRVYEDIRRRLDEELGVPPAPVLLQALRQVTQST